MLVSSGLSLSVAQPEVAPDAARQIDTRWSAVALMASDDASTMPRATARKTIASGVQAAGGPLDAHDWLQSAVHIIVPDRIAPRSRLVRASPSCSLGESAA
jgi:hypothetical protein